MKNTTRTVRLEGELGEKFGEVWNLNVQTPHEAIRAIECQTQGFRNYILDTAEKGIGYEVLIGDQGIQQEEELIYPAPMRDDFTFIPVPQGGKSRGFGMLLFGLALMIPGLQAMSAMMAPTAPLPGLGGVTVFKGHSMAKAFSLLSPMQSIGMTMGGALMAGGAALMLAPTIDSSAGNEEQSYLFDGAINSAKQGTPVPILYGRMIVGGATVSAIIKSNQYKSTANPRGRTYVRGIGSGTYGGFPAYQGHQTSGKKGKR